MCVVTLAWMKYVSQFNPKQFVKYGVRIFNIDPIICSDEEIIEYSIEKTKEFFVKLGMRTILNEMSIDDKQFESMANRATNGNTQHVGHLKPLYNEDIFEILKLAQ
ncbi:hypothetical protein IGI80_001349 [Enterococcus sp. DIV1420a]